LGIKRGESRKEFDRGTITAAKPLKKRGPDPITWRKKKKDPLGCIIRCPLSKGGSSSGLIHTVQESIDIKKRKGDCGRRNMEVTCMYIGGDKASKKLLKTERQHQRCYGEGKENPPIKKKRRRRGLHKYLIISGKYCI